MAASQIRPASAGMFHVALVQTGQTPSASVAIGLAACAISRHLGLTVRAARQWLVEQPDAAVFADRVRTRMVWGDLALAEACEDEALAIKSSRSAYRCDPLEWCVLARRAVA